jgi:hypothetical protein
MARWVPSHIASTAAPASPVGETSAWAASPTIVLTVDAASWARAARLPAYRLSRSAPAGRLAWGNRVTVGKERDGMVPRH